MRLVSSSINHHENFGRPAMANDPFTRYVHDNWEDVLASMNNANIRKKMLKLRREFNPLDHDDRKRYQPEKVQSNPSFLSCRLTLQYRAIVALQGNKLFFLHADKHDKAYEWAERHTIEALKDGITLVTHERARAVTPSPNSGKLNRGEIEQSPLLPTPGISLQRGGIQEEPKLSPGAALFASYSDQKLIQVGVKKREVATVKRCAKLEELMGYVSDLVWDRLDELLNGSRFEYTLPQVNKNTPLEETALSRTQFARAEDVDRVGGISWALFLDERQRRSVEMSVAGPLRITGAAGTGKTIVALHRVAHLVRQDKRARVLLTTTTKELASRLRKMLDVLLGKESEESKRVQVDDLLTVARGLQKGLDGRSISMTSAALVRKEIRSLMKAHETHDFSEDFLFAEWSSVIAPHDIQSLKAYQSAQRNGRRFRLNADQRKRAWLLFDRLNKSLKKRKSEDEDRFLLRLSKIFGRSQAAPFDHIVVDESQNLRYSQLVFLRSLAAPGPNDLTLAGDPKQRTHTGFSSLKQAGIEIVGRSVTLNINYRSTARISEFCDAVRPDSDLDDLDEATNERNTITHEKPGVPPEVIRHASAKEEISFILRKLHQWKEEGIALHKVGILVPVESLEKPLINELKKAGGAVKTIRGSLNTSGKSACITDFARSVGLEFDRLILARCNDTWLPQKSALAQLDQQEREEQKALARSLFYTAAARACQELVISHSGKPSALLPKRLRSQPKRKKKASN